MEPSIMPQTRELQLKGLEMARYFKEFCEKHGLLFYFCGGIRVLFLGTMMWIFSCPGMIMKN